MNQKLKEVTDPIVYTFPVRLLINHIKRNHVLLLCWLVLFAIVTGKMGSYMGVPYLFLDPVYLNKVNMTSFFIVGASLAVFTGAFHITSYINDGHRFPFIGTLVRPFLIYSFNNSIIPFGFLITYVILIMNYQQTFNAEYGNTLFFQIAGLLMGYILTSLAFIFYFRFTNQNIFKHVVCAVDEKLKQNIKATRAGAMKKLDIARKKQIRVDNYWSAKFEKKSTKERLGFYDRETIIQVFDQNHFNLMIFGLIAFIIFLVMGLFKDNPIFQIPAAASFILILSVFIMLAGAFVYWFGNWATSLFILLIFSLNFAAGKGAFLKKYHAFGLNYNTESSEYTLEAIDKQNSIINREKDKKETLQALNNWREKFPEKKPKMVFICTSGGGQRAALWTFNVLQTVDSITKGRLMEHTMVMTGASGGLIGSSYFRELKLQSKLDNINPYDPKYYESLGNDNLNAIFFSFLMNDLFSKLRKFEYQGHKYAKDRGYTFEQQLDANTGGSLDKPLSAYRQPELQAQIPMMIMAPTIINDGRKLYISPLHTSYLINPPDSNYDNQKTNGVEFIRLFEKQNGDKLRFLSGLRMSATFPYITPNITLPSSPPLEIMDAGVTDNFGISDAVSFIHAFKDWIAANTSGVVVLSIRDSRKNAAVEKKENLSLFDNLTMPISSIYQNFESLQDITNDNKLDYVRNGLENGITQIDIQYLPDEEELSQKVLSDSTRFGRLKRASLSWRLTKTEKESIRENIKSKHNQIQIERLIKELQYDTP